MTRLEEIRARHEQALKLHVKQADVAYLLAQLDKAGDALRSLHDVQNGSPLPSYDKAWDKAMRDAKDVLRELGK